MQVAIRQVVVAVLEVTAAAKITNREMVNVQAALGACSEEWASATLPHSLNGLQTWFGWLFVHLASGI